jgi:hypothetical protein
MRFESKLFQLSLSDVALYDMTGIAIEPFQYFSSGLVQRLIAGDHWTTASKHRTARQPIVTSVPLVHCALSLERLSAVKTKAVSYRIGRIPADVATM